MPYTTDDQQRDAHAVMTDRFNSLASTIMTPEAEDGAADEMLKILNTYAEQFNCSTASAYSRIKYNLLSLRTGE